MDRCASGTRLRVRHSYADHGDVGLHHVEAGDMGKWVRRALAKKKLRPGGGVGDVFGDKPSAYHRPKGSIAKFATGNVAKLFGYALYRSREASGRSANNVGATAPPRLSTQPCSTPPRGRLAALLPSTALQLPSFWCCSFGR